MHIQTSPYVGLTPRVASAARLGPNLSLNPFDPIGSAASKIRDGFEATGKALYQGALGATPGVGSYLNGRNAIAGAWNGRSGVERGAAVAGTLANAAGTLGLGVALVSGSSLLGQASAALLIGSGVTNAFYNA